MKVYYDKEVDAAYIKLSEEVPSGVIEISEGINIDVTDKGEIVGIEILEASKKFPLKSLFTYEYEYEHEQLPRWKRSFKLFSKFKFAQRGWVSYYSDLSEYELLKFNIKIWKTHL